MLKWLGKSLLGERTVSKYLPTKHLLLSNGKMWPLLLLCGCGNDINQLSNLASPVGPADTLRLPLHALRKTHRHLWHPCPKRVNWIEPWENGQISKLFKKKSVLWEAKQIEKNFSRLKKTKGIWRRTTTHQKNSCSERQNSNMDRVVDNSVYQQHCLHLLVVLGYVRKCSYSWERCAEVFRDEGLSCLKHPQIVHKK